MNPPKLRGWSSVLLEWVEVQDALEASRPNFTVEQLERVKNAHRAARDFLLQMGILP